MYAQHFGLDSEPFTIAPDPRYLYLGERHREALAHLLYGLEGGGGFVLLTGEVGAGKTTVCRAFLEQVPARCRLAYVFNPKLTAVELLAVVCDEFGLRVSAPPGEQATIKTYVDALNAFLLAAHAAGRHCVLVIDEAQQLAPEVLEQLRLLTNLETSERKLLQIILIGQPELRDMLARPGLAQLAQRVIARYHLGPLDESDTGRYVAHRLAVAGLRGPNPFGPGLTHAIHRLSAGVPRRINLLCDRALLGAYSQGRAAVDRRTLDKAAHEVFWPASGLRGRPPWRTWGFVLAGLASVAVLGAGGWWAWSQQGAASRAALVGRTDAVPASRTAAAAPLAMAGASQVGSTASAPVSAPRAAASAPGTAGRPPAAALPAPERVSLDELRRRLATVRSTEAEAWRELTALWGEPLPAGEPCTAATRLRLNCYSTRAGLLRLRSVDRPSVIVLRAGEGPPLHLVLIGLGARDAWLQAGNTRLAIGLDELALAWQGEFGTLWRSPEPASIGATADTPEATAAQLLARLDPSRPAPAEPADLRRRIAAFQMAQGLIPDGDLGALTQMMLNRAAGVAEPRLASAP